MRLKCSATSGFTLIELLTVVFIFSVLALMSYRGLAAVIDTREHVAQETAKWRTLASFFARFERDVHLAMPRAVQLRIVLASGEEIVRIFELKSS